HEWRTPICVSLCGLNTAKACLGTNIIKWESMRLKHAEREFRKREMERFISEQKAASSKARKDDKGKSLLMASLDRANQIAKRVFTAIPGLSEVYRGRKGGGTK